MPLSKLLARGVCVVLLAAGPAAPTLADDVQLFPLPAERLFPPLIADPKERRWLVSVLHVRGDSQSTDIAAIGTGEHFGLVCGCDPLRREGWALGLDAGIFSQFDLRTSSQDLLNADYLIGFPLDVRRGPWAARVRLYHQSSHLGDEFLLREELSERINFSYEALELLVSGETGRWRFYGGGDWLIKRTPAELGHWLWHGGAEYRRRLQPWWRFTARRMVAALDVKVPDSTAWSSAVSAKAGFEVLAPAGGRAFRLLLNYYDGAAPYGQFYASAIRYAGISLEMHFH